MSPINSTYFGFVSLPASLTEFIFQLESLVNLSLIQLLMYLSLNIQAY